ncbi:MAG: DUF3137 domain-containing protein [Bacteroidia bacterium]|nr:DUF3137 domain-containing protein [Bacteroidia bacterium]
MKSIDQLREFFNNDLKSSLKAVEAKRLSIVYKVIAMVVVMAALLATIVYYMVKADWSIGWIFFVVLVLPVLTGALFYDMISNRDFYMDFKTEVIERILKFIDPSFTYISHKYIAPAQLVESRLFVHLPKKYKGDDYVSGIIGQNTKIEFSEVVARHKSVLQEANKQSSEWKLTFKGLYFVAQTDRSFAGHTFIIPAGESSDSLMQVHGHIPEKVDLGDDKFGTFFSVYSTNPAEARQLIKQPMIDRLVEFRSHRTNPVRISFVGNKINVAIWHEKDLFEPRIFKTLIDFSLIEEYYDDLYQAISVMEYVEGTKVAA